MSSASTKKEKKPVEVVSFDDPDKKIMSKKAKAKRLELEFKKKSKSKLQQKAQTVQRPVFDQRQASFDIRKVAIEGMGFKQKESAMADYLMLLGARKPHGKHVTIKDYMQSVQKADLKQSANRREKEMFNYRFGKNEDALPKKAKFKTKKSKDDFFRDVDGQVGIYRKGVQYINRVEKVRRNKKMR